MKSAKILKEARERKGLSQSDVTKPLGYQSYQIMSNIERGSIATPPNLLKEMCEVYDIDYKSTAIKVVDDIIDKKRKQLLKKYDVK